MWCNICLFFKIMRKVLQMASWNFLTMSKYTSNNCYSIVSQTNITQYSFLPPLIYADIWAASKPWINQKDAAESCGVFQACTKKQRSGYDFQNFPEPLKIFYLLSRRDCREVWVLNVERRKKKIKNVAECDKLFVMQIRKRYLQVKRENFLTFSEPVNEVLLLFWELKLCGWLHRWWA